MIKRILTLLLLFAPCLLPFASAQGLSEQAIIQKMVSAAEEIKTIQCSFTQTKHSKMLVGEQVSQGKMFCQKPYKLRWEYTSPRASSILLDETNKGKGLVGSIARLIMNSVAGKCLTDDKAFLVTAKEIPTGYEATLVPLKKEMKRMFTRLVLRFDVRQSTVTEVELHERNGDSTIIELHDIQTGK